MFGRKRRYNRTRLLAAAARAQRKGRLCKAIALYREVLAAEPGNLDVERKVAPLLARRKQRGDAWASYRHAAEGLAREGLVERAIGVLREGAELLPREGALWLALAELELKRGRRADAVGALWRGAQGMRARADRTQALRLLERAHAIDPTAFEVSLELAARLARAGRRPQALRLLDELAAKKRGPALRRVRARQFRVSPGPGSAWRLLRDAIS